MADPKRPGRPPLDAKQKQSSPICFRLGASDYDRIDKLAKHQRTTMSEVIRKGLKHLLHDNGSLTSA